MELESTKPSRFEVLRYSIISTWHWANTKNEDCSICRGALDMPCVICNTHKKNNNVCGQTTGTCGHSYHVHCLEEWINKQQTCPLCQKEWVALREPTNSTSKVPLEKISIGKHSSSPHLTNTSIKKANSVIKDIIENKKKSMPTKKIYEKGNKPIPITKKVSKKLDYSSSKSSISDTDDIELAEIGDTNEEIAKEYSESESNSDTDEELVEYTESESNSDCDSDCNSD